MFNQYLKVFPCCSRWSKFTFSFVDRGKEAFYICCLSPLIIFKKSTTLTTNNTINYNVALFPIVDLLKPDEIQIDLKLPPTASGLEQQDVIPQEAQDGLLIEMDGKNIAYREYAGLKSVKTPILCQSETIFSFKPWSPGEH